MPVLALDEAGGYVAAAYLVFLTLILCYVGIMGLKLTRKHSQLEQLANRVQKDDHG